MPDTEQPRKGQALPPSAQTGMSLRESLPLAGIGAHEIDRLKAPDRAWRRQSWTARHDLGPACDQRALCGLGPPAVEARKRRPPMRHLYDMIAVGPGNEVERVVYEILWTDVDHLARDRARSSGSHPLRWAHGLR